MISACFLHFAYVCTVCYHLWISADKNEVSTRGHDGKHGGSYYPILECSGREEEARLGLEQLFRLNGESFEFDDHNCALTFHEQRMDEITGLNMFKLHP